jgi:hypothetical protein
MSLWWRVLSHVVAQAFPHALSFDDVFVPASNMFLGASFWVHHFEVVQAPEAFESLIRGCAHP